MNISPGVWDLVLDAIKTNKYTDNHLNLSGLMLDDANAKELALALVENYYITSLDVGLNRFGNKGAITLAQSKKLVFLDISSNKIEDEGAIALANIQSLNCLIIKNNQIKDAGAIALASNMQLKTLNLRANQITDLGAIALASSKSLSTLNISDNSIKDTGAIALATSNTLMALDLSSTEITELSALALAANPTLKSLCLSDSFGCTTDAVIRALADNKNLETLDISFNNLDCERVAILAKNDSLTTLNVCSNNLKDLGAVALAGNKQLISLNIKCNMIGDEGIVALGKNTQLKHLDIHNNYLNMSEKALREAFEKNETLVNLGIDLLYEYCLPRRLLNNALDFQKRQKVKTLSQLSVEERSLIIRDRVLGPYEQRLECIEAFLMGTHKTVGAHSSIQALLNPNLFDPALLTMTFDFLGHAPVSKRNQVERLNSKRGCSIKQNLGVEHKKESTPYTAAIEYIAAKEELKNKQIALPEIAVGMAFLTIILGAGFFSLVPVVLTGIALVFWGVSHLFDRETGQSERYKPIPTSSPSIPQITPPATLESYKYQTNYQGTNSTEPDFEMQDHIQRSNGAKPK